MSNYFHNRVFFEGDEQSAIALCAIVNAKYNRQPVRASDGQWVFECTTSHQTILDNILSLSSDYPMLSFGVFTEGSDYSDHTEIENGEMVGFEQGEFGECPASAAGDAENRRMKDKMYAAQKALYDILARECAWLGVNVEDSEYAKEFKQILGDAFPS